MVDVSSLLCYTVREKLISSYLIDKPSQKTTQAREKGKLFMKKMLIKVYNSRRLTLILKTTSHISVFAIAAAFFALLVYNFSQDYLSALKLLLATGIPFVIVSIFRRVINAPRPYELYDFYERKPKEKRGLSFPSRHVFSAFIIATVSASVSIYLSVGLFLVGFALAASRVLLGIHFIRDVVAGALVGVIAGVVGLVLIIC